MKISVSRLLRGQVRRDSRADASVFDRYPLLNSLMIDGERVRLDKEFDEDDVVRDESGKFSSTGGGGGSAKDKSGSPKTRVTIKETKSNPKMKENSVHRAGRALAFAKEHEKLTERVKNAKTPEERKIHQAAADKAAKMVERHVKAAEKFAKTDDDKAHASAARKILDKIQGKSSSAPKTMSEKIKSWNKPSPASLNKSAETPKPQTKEAWKASQGQNTSYVLKANVPEVKDSPEAQIAKVASKEAEIAKAVASGEKELSAVESMQKFPKIATFPGEKIYQTADGNVKLISNGGVSIYSPEGKQLSYASYKGPPSDEELGIETPSKTGHAPKADHVSDSELKQLRENFKAKLSKEQLEAAYAYTHRSDGVINNHLRGLPPPNEYHKQNLPGAKAHPTDEEHAANIERFKKNLDDAISSHPIPRDMTVYRGMITKHLGDLEIGAEIEDHGYMSTSVDRSIAESFAGAGYKKESAVLQIKLPKGHHAAPIQGKFDGEKEMLLPRGMKMRVVGVEIAKSINGYGSQRIIHVEVVSKKGKF